MAIVLVVLIVLQVFGMVFFDDHQNRLLEEHGQFTETIVVNKTRERRGRGAAGYYIHYIFTYNGKEYKHDAEIDSVEIGDTIEIKFYPENPENHRVLTKGSNR